ncbi:MAG: hypothetical protein QMD50_01710 [Patescibacteria group bacterium]|nr:hypothetical protein [Patescibacteria group bacterium]
MKSIMISGMHFGTEFLTNVYKKVLEKGGTEELIFNAMKTESGLAEKIADLIVDTSRNVPHIFADLTLSDRIKRGKYDWVNSDITEKNFPTNVPADYKAEYKLFHFNRYISSEDVIKEMDKEGFRPGVLAELLAFGEKEPDLQRQFPIVALGSLWRLLSGCRCVPVLDHGDAGRGLGLSLFELVWNGHHRFLAVRK